MITRISAGSSRRSRCWARRRWFTFSIAARARSGISMGGTGLGLTFGVIGFAFMIFAGLLGARKKVPVWRIGRAQTWMRGHLWLGLLSLPILLLHSGFRYGHGLTAVLMTLLIIVVASGIFGAALQHYMPRVMTREVTMETIYEEIGHVRAQLLEEAEELIAKATAVPEKAAAAGAADSAAASATAIAASVAVPEGNGAASQFFRQGIETVSGKAGGARERAGGCRAGAQRVCAIAYAGAAGAARRDRRPGKYLRGGAAADAAKPSARVAARMAAAAYSLSLALLLLGAAHALMALRY